MINKKAVPAPFTINEAFIQPQPNRVSYTQVIPIPFTISPYFINPNLTVVDPRITYTAPYSTECKEHTIEETLITYPGVRPGLYKINTNGQIHNTVTGKELIPFERWNNTYRGVTLQMLDTDRKTFYLHRLVAYQFCKPPANFTELAVNHIDGNKTNNKAENLEWITIAANNQHAQIMKFHSKDNIMVANGRPVVNEEFVRYLCEQFVAGKPNTQIMEELGMDINNANHTILRDIRGGATWRGVTSQYSFDRSSKKHAYTNGQKKKIEKLMIEGKSLKEIFKIMIGREYVAATDRKDSSYRTIQSIQTKLRGYGYNV